MGNLGMFLVERSLGFNLIRTIFVCLDYVAFTVFGWATQAVFDIANATLIGPDKYAEFANRVYVLIGIFMLFKITVTMLGYLVNPDKITDKTEGLSKIVGRTIVSIAMLVGLPFLWNLMFDREINGKTITQILLEAVPRVLIGKNSSITEGKDGIESVSNTIVWKTYSVVFKNADGSEVTDFNTMEAAVENVNVSTDGDNSKYRYDYTLFLGFIIGIVMSIVMISIAIDVAIRAFKLIILRMIAPIPILGYILPQSQKNGGIFSNWLKTLLLTWLDLFIKIGVVYLALYFIDIIILQGSEADLGVSDFRLVTLKVFIIIGLLFFAKQAPKFITDLLGIKNKEGGLGFAKALTAGVVGAGAVGSGVASARAAYAANKVNGHNKGLGIAKAIGAGAFGVGAGAATGIGAALGAKDHNAKAALSAINKRNNRAFELGNKGSTLMGRFGAGASDLLGIPTRADRMENQIKADQEYSKALGNTISRVKDKTATSTTTTGTATVGGKTISGNYASFVSSAEAQLARGSKTIDFSGQTIAAEDYALYKEELFKSNQNDYYATNGAGTLGGSIDEDLVDLKATQDSLSSSSSVGGSLSSFGDVKSTAGKASRAANAMERDGKYKASKANRDASRK